MVFSLR